ncbi:shikimate dehydrogenase [Bacillus oleivorans]|uniref:Shikimate dehydrogenase (NADP(+)) n=1 Tax=Bacillus oleivorans TaxID=1448271 RepID=A0A285CJZ2_9BACI|nr:shikimate dehydrogenase [Bacillus oleivorans]SNX67839.1 shikimate dehydrogenase [Bacillus oleivorans]
MEKVFGVIGDPIRHSLSPLIHNHSFAKEKMEAVYHAFLVNSEDLESAVRGMKAIGIEGFNVTIPHKEAIISHLDEIDPLAKEIGAVNTVILRNGSYIGYNTDGIGFVKGLKQSINEETAEQKQVLIIGAGGAAKGIYYSLLADGFTKVDLANRSVERARQLVSGSTHPLSSFSNTYSLLEAEENLDQYDILIQTTSVGMSPRIEESPLTLQKLKEKTHVFDIIYNPFETKFLTLAKEKGCHIHNGIDMFVYQGAYAFQLWTGKWPDTDEMKELVINRLGG